MADDVIYYQWIPRGDTDKIDEYKQDGWEISEVDCHHGVHAVLAVKGKFSED